MPNIEPPPAPAARAKVDLQPSGPTASSKPPLVFRVGVTGHRSDAASRGAVPDVLQLRATIGTLLRHIAHAVDGVARTHGDRFDLGVGLLATGPPLGTLRLVCAMAEGADLWAADEALKLGYELECTLPFPREDYEKDFTDPLTRAEFGRLLHAARLVLELDRPLDSASTDTDGVPAAAYEAAERAVLNRADLLVAIRDGEPPQGRGGTAEVVAEALQRGIPAVWVNWNSPKKWALRLPQGRRVTAAPGKKQEFQRLESLVVGLLLPPDATTAPSG